MTIPKFKERLDRTPLIVVCLQQKLLYDFFILIRVYIIHALGLVKPYEKFTSKIVASG